MLDMRKSLASARIKHRVAVAAIIRKRIVLLTDANMLDIRRDNPGRRQSWQRKYAAASHDQ